MTTTRKTLANVEFAAFSRRIIRAHSRRVGAGDIEGLADLANLASDVHQAIGAAADQLHTAGYSWGDIGRVLGITRQSARERFDRPPAK